MTEYCTSCGSEVEKNHRYCWNCGSFIKTVDTEEFEDVELPRDHAILLDVVRKAGEIEPGDLYERYEKRVENPRSKRTVRKYMGDLDDRGLVNSTGERRGRRYAAPAQEEEDDQGLDIQELTDRL